MANFYSILRLINVHKHLQRQKFHFNVMVSGMQNWTIFKTIFKTTLGKKQNKTMTYLTGKIYYFAKFVAWMNLKMIK